MCRDVLRTSRGLGDHEICVLQGPRIGVVNNSSYNFRIDYSRHFTVNDIDKNSRYASSTLFPFSFLGLELIQAGQ